MAAGLTFGLSLFLCRVLSSNASSGDRAPDYQACLLGCTIHRCVHSTPSTPRTCTTVCDATNTSLYRSGVARWWPWTCAQECRYQCMWQRVHAHGHGTASTRGAAHVIDKYHGKWPFVRVLGAQEGAAAALSLANLAAHVHGIQRLWRVCGRPQQRTRNTRWVLHMYTGQGVLAIASWGAAAAFHTRDTGPTEGVDYFFADAVVFCSLIVTMLRVWGVGRPRRAAGVVVAGCLLFARHWLYMTRVVFDYGFNMWVCTALGVANALVWLMWAWRGRHPARRAMSAWFGALFACMALEVFDFAPWWWLVDAHALWHACTVPLTGWWYKLLAADLLYLI